MTLARTGNGGGGRRGARRRRSSHRGLKKKQKKKKTAAEGSRAKPRDGSDRKRRGLPVSSATRRSPLTSRKRRLRRSRFHDFPPRGKGRRRRLALRFQLSRDVVVARRGLPVPRPVTRADPRACAVPCRGAPGSSRVPVGSASPYLTSEPRDPIPDATQGFTPRTAGGRFSLPLAGLSVTGRGAGLTREGAASGPRTPTMPRAARGRRRETRGLETAAGRRRARRRWRSRGAGEGSR